jgi:hypothetical protein
MSDFLGQSLKEMVPQFLVHKSTSIGLSAGLSLGKGYQILTGLFEKNPWEFCFYLLFLKSTS